MADGGLGDAKSFGDFDLGKAVRFIAKGEGFIGVGEALLLRGIRTRRGYEEGFTHSGLRRR